MGTYQRKDRYYYKAKEMGLPSRAAFKIEEILNKFKLVKPGDTVLDLGAAPGGWTALLAKAVGPKGCVLALDLQAMPRVKAPHIKFFQGDFFGEAAKLWLEEQLKGWKVSGVFSDLSPKLSGIAFKDAYDSFELANNALALAQQYLTSGGNFVTKIFPGEEFKGFLEKLRSHFERVKTFEPQSSRRTSREVYLLGMGYKTK
jgi:23S rRNA (uridine2552-2'-O)-methyltransferase